MINGDYLPWVTKQTGIFLTINMLGKKMASKEMKGAALIGGKCIMPGQACGGGCDVPDPVCCYGYYCTDSNGIIYNTGICVAPGTTPTEVWGQFVIDGSWRHEPWRQLV